jgi:ubiquinone/menaquinone biosynthesis C-methylase UbiE
MADKEDLERSRKDEEFSSKDGTLPDPKNPAECDSLNFEETEWVSFWKKWQRRSPVDDLTELVQTSNFQGGLENFSSLSPMSVHDWGLSKEGSTKYWSYHLLRSGFFVAQAAAGLAVSRTREETADTMGYLTTNTGLRLYTEALQMFRQDFSNIKAGYYKEPYDMDLRHRQFNPLFILERSLRFLREAPKTLKRRTTGVAEDIWLKSHLYPDYYMNSWHYQTDGWLSSESAGVYETSTETLFLGQQDAMQRATLVPLAKHFKGKDLSSSSTKIMELACGTGRFATFVKDNFPEAHVTALDLSPFYLQEARKNMEHWWELQDQSQVPTMGADFLQAPAENIPVPDASYDAITCVYLFHELTQEVRQKIVSEMNRILKPGGVVVFTDSIQLGDRPELDANIDNFTDFNEPNYSDYVRTDLGALFKQGGFTCDTKDLASRSKILSFVKNEEYLQ